VAQRNCTSQWIWIQLWTRSKQNFWFNWRESDAFSIAEFLIGNLFIGHQTIRGQQHRIISDLSKACFPCIYWQITENVAYPLISSHFKFFGKTYLRFCFFHCYCVVGNCSILLSTKVIHWCREYWAAANYTLQIIWCFTFLPNIVLQQTTHLP